MSKNFLTKLYLSKVIKSNNDSAKLIEDLLHALFLSEFSNAKNPSSIYRFVLNHGKFCIWDFEKDVEPVKWASQEVYNRNKNATKQGLNEVKVIQPFCYKILKEINNNLFMFESKPGLVVVLGDYGQRLADEVYADIIIGHEEHYSEFNKSPPNLSKGLGWEVKNNNLTDGSKSIEG